jgi:hypothetical protein
MSPVANPFTVMAVFRHLASPDPPQFRVVHSTDTRHTDTSSSRHSNRAPGGIFAPEGPFPPHEYSAAASVSSLGSSGSKEIMQRLSPRCQVPCREAATPCPQHAAVLPISISSCAWPHHSRTSARPMKHRIPIRANRVPGHPASFVRSIRTVGSPQSLLRGSLIDAQVSRIGSISGRNLVVLDPQSKCFFSHLECKGLMANGG